MPEAINNQHAIEQAIDDMQAAAPAAAPAAALLAWFEQAIPVDARKGAGATALEQLGYFFAYRQADAIFGDFSVRDLAEFLREGFSGYKTLEDIAGGLSEMGVEDADDDELHGSLQLFFG